MLKARPTASQLLYTWHLRKMDKKAIFNLNHDTIASKKLQSEVEGEAKVA